MLETPGSEGDLVADQLPRLLIGDEMKGLRPGEHKDIKIPFGKYKGTLICDLSDDYLLYLKDQTWLKDWPEVEKQVGIENKYRNTYTK